MSKLLYCVSGIGTGQASLKQCIELARRPNVQQGWRKCRHLIIDEISMVDGEFFGVSFITLKSFCNLSYSQCT